MTTRPLRPCRRPGCPNLTRDKGGYCPLCLNYGQQRVKRQNAQRNRNKKTLAFYGTARWQKLRAWKKRRYPLCEDCLDKGKTVATACVDHIVELKDGGEPLNMDNLRSLCWQCHSVKTEKIKRERNQ